MSKSIVILLEATNQSLKHIGLNSMKLVFAESTNPLKLHNMASFDDRCSIKLQKFNGSFFTR